MMTGSSGLWGRWDRNTEPAGLCLLVFKSRKPDKTPGLKKASMCVSLFYNSQEAQAKIP